MYSRKSTQDFGNSNERRMRNKTKYNTKPAKQIKIVLSVSVATTTQQF